MPEPAQCIARALPATHFVRMIRGIVLRGASLDQLVGDSLFLVAFTVAGRHQMSRPIRRDFPLRATEEKVYAAYTLADL
ncbi:MAG: hypothetical protein U5K56_04380 [Halioglobus sp.]|nr:hypothetical protein [Halioglobus sp.]